MVCIYTFMVEFCVLRCFVFTILFLRVLSDTEKKPFLKIMVPYLITEYPKITQYNRSKIIV